MCQTTLAVASQDTLEPTVRLQVYYNVCYVTLCQQHSSSEYTDDCVINPCQNGATCRKLAGDTACLCPAYYTGVTCGLRKLKQRIKF